MSKINWLSVAPIVIYLVSMLYIAHHVSKGKHTSKNFMKEYFLGNRSTGGFVLAMTIVATYVGASSFIGGPGVAYQTGLGWVLLACIQVPTAFFTLGILGKKLAILSRKLGAVTIFDIVKKRYNNDIVVILSSILLIVFFVGAIVAQFIGGARLFESLLGIPYIVGLIIFAAVVIIYTTIGGFRAVTITDAIQTVVMLVATIVLFFVILRDGNGMHNIMMKIKEINPALLTPSSGGNIAKPFIMSFWVLVGIGVLALPSNVIRCMAFKDTKAMHRAMIIGTSVVGILILGMHFVGILGLAIEPDLKVGDTIIPTLALNHLHPVLAGIFIGGPLAAIMSSVDSLLIMISSTLVKDIYTEYINKKADNEHIKKVSLFISLSIGIVVFLLSIKPISLIVWVNLFSLAGQEIVFLCPLLLGLYWRGANATGVISSIIFGSSFYLYLSITGMNIYQMHNIVPSLVVSLTVFIVGSLIGKKTDEKTLELFFD